MRCRSPLHSEPLTGRSPATWTVAVSVPRRISFAGASAHQVRGCGRLSRPSPCLTRGAYAGSARLARSAAAATRASARAAAALFMAAATISKASGSPSRARSATQSRSSLPQDAAEARNIINWSWLGSTGHLPFTPRPPPFGGYRVGDFRTAALRERPGLPVEIALDPLAAGELRRLKLRERESPQLPLVPSDEPKEEPLLRVVLARVPRPRAGGGAEGGRNFGLRSGCFRLNLARQLAEKDLLQLDLVAGVVNVDAHEPSIRIVIQDNALRNLAALDARAVAQLDVQRVCIGVVVELQGWKPRPGKALWIVIIPKRQYSQVPAIKFGSCGQRLPALVS